MLPVVPDCAASTAVWYVHGVVPLCRDTDSISLFSQHFAAFKMLLGGNLGSECVASSQYKGFEAGTYETVERQILLFQHFCTDLIS